MRRMIASATLSAAALSAGPAFAGPLASLAETGVLTCNVGVVPTSDVVLALLSSAKVPMTQEVIDHFQDRTLGKYAASRLSDKDWIAVSILANSLVVDGPNQPEEGYSVSVNGAPQDEAVAVRRLLNRDAPWLEVKCTPPPEQSEAGGDSDKAGQKWVIARSLEDADQATSDRGFATISYTKDYEAKEDIISTELFVGLPSIESGLGPDHTFRPYLLYQRRTGEDPLNDLTFGASSRWFVRGGAVTDHVFYLNGEYETDDDFDSEVWRGELVWGPVLKGRYDLCGSQVGDGYGFSCRFRGVVDWQDVSDAGKKTALQDEPEFARFGADLRLAAYWNLPAGGSLELGGQFTVREPFDGDEGDASFGDVSLSYVPEGLPNISFGVNYFEGEDLTSLERAKTLKFTLGFRN